MSGKSNSASYSQNRTDTMIGAGVRIDGNIAFTGVLRVQGNILGEVLCDLDSSGTLVVDSSGSVTGTITAPHIVVRGHAYGPVHSSRSIQIQEGACVAGDAFYNEIGIHAGGVIDGSLTPTVPIEDRSRQEHRVQVADAPAINDYGMQLTNGGGLAGRFGSWRNLGGAIVLVMGVATLLWMNREPTVIVPPAADVALKADSAMKGAVVAQAAPVARDGLQDSPKAGAGDAVPLASGANADTNAIDQKSSPDRGETDPDKVVPVQGVNPRKPAGVILVISREPSVLFKKKRQDTGDGTRINVSQGVRVSIAVAKDEILRVDKGRDTEIIYQGRKVAPRTVESGAWISFVPHSASDAGDER